MCVLLQLVLLPLPWQIRRFLLCRLFHYKIDKSAKIGMSIIMARELVMGPHSRIQHGVICKAIDRLMLGEDSGIANFTFITGFGSERECFGHFAHVKDRRCELILGRSAGITSRHFVDCNGGVYIDDFATVAGIRSQILTHSIDVYSNRQDAQPVHIGRYCFVGTGCIILPGSILPDYCVLAAGSVLTKAQRETSSLYAGVPAILKKNLDVKNVPYFWRNKHVVD